LNLLLLIAYRSSCHAWQFVTFLFLILITFIFFLQKNEWIIGQDPEMCTRSSELYAKASQPPITSLAQMDVFENMSEDEYSDVVSRKKSVGSVNRKELNYSFFNKNLLWTQTFRISNSQSKSNTKSRRLLVHYTFYTIFTHNSNFLFR